MKVMKETVAGIVVLTLKGEFDSFVTNAFSNEIQKVQEQGGHQIVLNMRLVKFINSTALGAMIKARKGCKAAKGDLVVSQPSAAVREAMESLGLDRLFSIYDDDESAIAALSDGDQVEMEEDEESAVMISVPEEARPIVGRLKRLDADSIDCRIRRPVEKLVPGREVKLKFRLPLYRREYFELSARIETVEPGAGSTVLSMRITRVSDDDREAIASFLDDMGELRKATREA